MREQSSTGWKRRGSSIVFDRESLGPLINGDAWMVSLREALAWTTSFPRCAPEKQTILITGLSAVLDVMQPEEAERFLSAQVTPLIERVQSRWDQCGIVLGFVGSESSFEVTSTEEEVLYKRGRKRVHISQALWDGSATLNLTRLVRHDQGQNRDITMGYYVGRIS
ncbi:MAG: hypothetical protein HN341_01275 [Verrucomicrobia bacterium]|jgi:hypothetical protein|nr:hypothetical protein [Verrucomicrobiota bacterium]